MRTATALAAVLALAVLTGCSGEDEPAEPAAAVSLDSIGTGDLCDQLTAGLLQDLTDEEFGTPQVSEDRDGRQDGCSSGSPDSGIAVTVEVWAEREGDLAADIHQLGSPAATTQTSAATVAGHDAKTAVADLEGVQMADLLLTADDRLLLVLVQQPDEYADGSTPDDQLALATTIAERLLPD